MESRREVEEGEKEKGKKKRKRERETKEERKKNKKESFGICNGVHLKVLSSHREQCDMADTVSFFL